MADAWREAVRRRPINDAYTNTLGEHNPIATRRANRLSKELGVPPEVVSADLEGHEAQANNQQAKTMFEYAPGLAVFAAQPNNAAAIKDDLPSMGEISKILGMAPPEETLTQKYVRALKGSTRLPAPPPPEGGPQLSVSRPHWRLQPGRVGWAGQVAGGIFSQFVAKPVIALAEAGPMGGLLKNQIAEARTKLGLLDYTTDVPWQPQGHIELPTFDDGWNKPLKLEVNLGRTSAQAATNVLPLLVTRGLGMSSRATLGALSAVSGADQYELSRSRGASVNEALAAAALSSVIEYGTEKLPVEFVWGKWGEKGVGAFARGYLGRELPTELMATTGQGLVAAQGTGGEGLAEFAKHLPQDLLDTGLSTAFMTGTLSGVQAIANRRQRALQDAQDATNGAAFLDAVMRNAEDSKVRKEDPDTFRTFVDQQAKDTIARNVYFNTEAVATFMQSEGYDGSFDRFKQQVTEAQAANQSDVVLPIGDVAAHLAKTSAWEALRDDARVKAGGASMREVREQAEDLEQFEKLGEDLRTQNIANKEFEETKEFIKKAMLSTDRVPAEVAENAAAIIASNAQMMAETARKQGEEITPLEAWKRANIGFMGFDEEGRPIGGTVPPRPGGPAPPTKPTPPPPVTGPARTGAQIAAHPAVHSVDDMGKEEGFFVSLKPGYTFDFGQTSANFDTKKEAAAAMKNVRPMTEEEFDAYTADRDKNEAPAAETPEEEAGRVLNQAPVDVTPLPAEEEVAALTGAARIANQRKWPNQRDFKLAVQEVIKAATKALREPARLMRLAFSDAMQALQSNQTAVGWYDEKVRQAEAVLAILHPEILTEPGAKFAFIYALSVTSNGMKVDDNFNLALKIYRAWRESGRMPAMGSGDKKKAMNKALLLFNDLVEQFGGLEQARDFLLTPRTARELTKMGYKINGENADTVVIGAAMFGPKIGNGFFANLYRQFDALTMDRWFMRSWGRWTGTLVVDNPALIKKNRDDLKTLLRALTPAEKKRIEAILSTPKKPFKIRVSEPDEFAKRMKQATTKEATRDALLETPTGDDLRRAGNRLHGNLDGQKEQPLNGTERNEIRSIMQPVLELLQDQYPDLNMADLQALLWYPEKLLYDSATGEVEKTAYAEDEIPDYANAAITLALSEGIPREQIDAVLERVNADIARDRAGAGGRGFSSDVLPHAGWLPQRLSGLIDRFGLDDGSSTAVAVMMTPDEYLGALASEKGRDLIAARVLQMPEYGPLNIDTLRASGPPIVTIAMTPGGDRSGPMVRGHDGRHRVEMLKQAGVARFPVVIQLMDKEGKPITVSEPLSVENVLPNRSREQVEMGDRPISFEGGIPISWKYEGQLQGLSNGARVLYQGKEEVFYSALERFLQNTPQKSATGKQWKGMLANAPGVKAEELEWSGLAEVFDLLHDQPLGRVHLIDLVHQRGIQISETVLGGPPPPLKVRTINDPEIQRALDDAEEKWLARQTDDNPPPWARAVTFDGFDAAHGTDPEQGPFKVLLATSGEFDQVIGPEYETAGQARRAAEAENTKQQDLAESRNEKIWAAKSDEEKMRIAADLSYYWPGDEYEEEEGYAPAEYPGYAATGETPSYRELLITLPAGKGGNPIIGRVQHFGVEGIIAHVRFGEMVDEDGKRVLFIEEIQSDLHQTGRRHGYRAPGEDKAIEDEANRLSQEAMDKRDAALNALLELYPEERKPFDFDEFAGRPQALVSTDFLLQQMAKVSDVAFAAAEAFQAAEEEFFQTMREVAEMLPDRSTDKRVPDAPFKKTWTELVVKRMVRWAAENGYERIAWTRGQEHVDRYPSLSAFTGPITIFKRADGQYALQISNKAVDELREQGIGQLVRSEGALSRLAQDFVMTVAEMDRAFGKEIADTLLTGATAVEGKIDELDAKIDKLDREIMVFSDQLTDFLNRLTPREGNEPINRLRQQALQDRITLARTTKKTVLEEYKFRMGTTSLQVGRAKGMKGYYDKILIETVNKMLKPFGEKVKPIHFDAAEQTAYEGFVARRKEGLARAEEDLARAIRDDLDAPTIRYYEEMVLDAQTRLNAEVARMEGGGFIRPGFDVNEKMVEAAMAGQALFQRPPAGAKGRIRLLDDGRKIIDLFATADMSTLIHEIGHAWLEDLQARANQPDAPQWVKDDWAAVQKWFADNGMFVTDQGQIPTPAHEMWARGHERFYMEGKAPTAKLQPVFKRFWAWLTRIYEVVENLNAPITPEIRDVMSRMVATQEAIDEFRATQNIKPAFATAEEAGMSEAAFADYQKSISDASDEAHTTLLFKMMEKIRKAKNTEQRQRRASIKADVAVSIGQQPEFVALHLLRTGRWLGDPERAKTPVKLNTGWLIETYGEEILDQLPKGLQLHKGNGEDADTIAELVGMNSGSELVEALVAMAKASADLKAQGEQRSLRDKLVDDEVDRQMADLYGDPLHDGSIEEEAIAALNTAAQGEILSSELRQLQKKASLPTRVTPYQYVRDWAKRLTSANKVRDVASRGSMQAHTRGAAKAARAFEKALLEGDHDEAYRQKQKQLIHHAQLAEAKIAADKVDKIVRRMQRIGKRAAMASVHPDYFDRVKGMLETYDFRPRTLKYLDEVAKFQEWAEDQRSKGYEVYIPPRLETEGQHYLDMTVEELEALDDVIQSLMAVGRNKQKLKIANEQRIYSEWRDEALAHMEKLPSRKLPEIPIGEENRKGSEGAGGLLKIETMAEEMDGGPSGPMNDFLVVAAADAENQRTMLRDKILNPLTKIYLGLKRKAWKRLQEKVTTTELTWNVVKEGDSDESSRLGKPVTLTRMQWLAVALNTGNTSNLEKMSKGERWEIDTIRKVLDEILSKEDWDLVQKMWHQIEQLWPDIVAVEREMSGVTPEKVTNTPIETRHGTYEGGYWPVVYDASRWTPAETMQDKQLDDMFGIHSGVATQKGHTITRTGFFGPMDYSIENILFSHVEQVVTRIAYAPFARDMMRMLNDGKITGMIYAKLGREYLRELKPWLQRQITQGATHNKGARWWHSMFRQLRVNMTAAAMGFRWSTLIAQTVGLTASAQRIGVLAVATGFKQMLVNPRRAARFVFERSPEMYHRVDSMNREIIEVAMRMRSGKRFSAMDAAGQKLATAQYWGLFMIGMMDRYAVSIPTWLGAYDLAMTKGIPDGPVGKWRLKRKWKTGVTEKEAADFADKTVRMSQGAGKEKDLAALQSLAQGEVMKYFTMFYTPFNVLFNAQWQGIRGLRKGDVRPAITVTFWWMIASVLADALMTGDWPEDEDEDGGVDWGAWFVRNVGFGLFAGVPLLRDAANFFERRAIGEYADLGSNPAVRTLEAGARVVQIGRTYAEEGELPDDPIKTGANLTSILTGLPIGQAGTTGQFLWDYSEGNTDPQGPADWYYGVTKDKVPSEVEE